MTMLCHWSICVCIAVSAFSTPIWCDWTPSLERMAAQPPPDDAVPLLVRLLAGNPATAAAILACLNTADTGPLRRLHPAVAAAVVDVPWADTGTVVVDMLCWRAALPAAVGARLTDRVVSSQLERAPALAALAGVTHLNLQGCDYVTDELLLRLPTSLRKLNVSCCDTLTDGASFAHLTRLTSLDCSWTVVVGTRLDGLPPSLHELDITEAIHLPDTVSFAHLSQLRVLHASDTTLYAAALATLPPSLLELRANVRRKRGEPAASFAHLRALRTLDVTGSDIGDTSLASLPPSLVSLNVSMCMKLTSAAVLPALPALQLLNVSCTYIGDALVGSLPAGLVTLRLVRCPRVSCGAMLDHVPALRTLYSFDTELDPDVIAACRARGCLAPLAGHLLGHSKRVRSLAVLSDDRLASGDVSGEVRVWDMATGGGATAVLATLATSGRVRALVGLPGGHRLAAGITFPKGGGQVEVWDVDAMPPERRATIDCGSRVGALAVLPRGRLAAGCEDGLVWIVSVDGDAVPVTAAALPRDDSCGWVTALAVLPDSSLVSASTDGSLRVWDVDMRACVASLADLRGGGVHSLAVLADGRLASGMADGRVGLWDVAARVCVGVLTGHASTVATLVALPDGRLASGSGDGTLRLWDTRPAATAAGSHAAWSVPVVVLAANLDTVDGPTLEALPDGRLVSTGRATDGCVFLLEVPPPAPIAAQPSTDILAAR